MKLLDFFKKKKKRKKTTARPQLTRSLPKAGGWQGGWSRAGGEPIKKVKKVEKKEKPKEKVASISRLKPKKREMRISPFILKEPHISEKATALAKENQYVFKVYPKANKTEIKKAMENLYGVNVLSVNLIKIPSKRRKLGRTQGFKKGYKKAVIKIKKGQTLELL